MTSESQKLSVREKVGYGVGDMAANFIFQTMVMFQLAFYPDTFGITEQRVPQKWIGKSLLDVNVRQKFDVSVIAIRRGGHMVANPKSDTRFEEDDTLLLIGENEALTRVARIL